VDGLERGLSVDQDRGGPDQPRSERRGSYSVGPGRRTAELWKRRGTGRIHRPSWRSPGKPREGLRFHDLRHSYASWLIASGVPITDAQKVMGHENPQTLLGIYAHVQEGSRDRILHALAAFSLPLGGSEADTMADPRVKCP
jgi:integrase